MGETQRERLLTAAIAWSLFLMLLKEKGNLEKKENYTLSIYTLHSGMQFLP